MTIEEKAGVLAGKVWEFLNKNGESTEKEIMKGIKTRRSSELYLALGWLLREGKLNETGTEDALRFSLK